MSALRLCHDFCRDALLLRTFPFSPLQLRQMRKPYASFGSICLLVGFHDAFLRCQFVAGVHSFDPNHAPALLYFLPCYAVHLQVVAASGTMFVFFVCFFFAMMLSSGRTVRWMLSGAGYLCRTAGYLYTRLGWFQPHVHASSLPLCAGCHGPFCLSLHALYAACAGHVLPHLSARYAHPHSHPAVPPLVLSRSIIAGCPSRLSGGPTRSVHANVLPSPVLTRAHSFRISSGRGGIAPPVQRGAAHPRTNPAARAAGGEPPPLKAPRAPRAPRKCRSSSGPGGRTPLSQLHRCGTVLGIRRSMSCCLGPASGSHTHSHIETPLGVPMWHTCSFISCPSLFTMRHCAPSDLSEEGVDMSLVKHSLGDGPTRSSSHLRCLRPLLDPLIHSRCSHVDLLSERTMHQPLAAARLRDPESSSDTSYHIICATYISPSPSTLS